MDRLFRFSKRRLALINGCLLLSLVTTWAQGQQTATCTSANSWLDNEDGQSPCDVASALLAPCTSTPIPPLAGQATYPNSEPSCSCNTVMYNLFSACAYCQGGDPSDFNTWTQSCAPVSVPVAYMSFPQNSLGVGIKTPLWAFTNVTSDGTFDLISIQKVATPVSHKWSTIQVVVPIVAVAATLVIGGITAYFMFQRIQRYQRLPDHKHSASIDQLSFFSFPSAQSKNSTSSSRPSKPRTHVWEEANLRNPKKFGIFTPSVKKVHSSERSIGWSITEGNEGDAHARAASSTSLGLIDEELAGPSNVASSSTTSAVVNGSQSFLPLRKGKSGSPPRPAGGAGGNATQITPQALTKPLPLIQDAPDVNLNNARPARGVGGARPPLVHIVSSQPPRGFHIDDTNSTVSPGSTDQPSNGAGPVLHPLASRTAAAATVSSPPVGAPESEGSVVLISRRPGENFTIRSGSMPVSPTSTEGWETITTSPESRGNARWTPAFSDSSSILPASLTRSTAPARAQIPNSPEDSADAMIPPSVRSAGYAPTAWQGRGSGSPSVPSSHSSAYTVPNPFTFNSRKENPLRSTPAQSTSASANRRPFDIDE